MMMMTSINPAFSSAAYPAPPVVGYTPGSYSPDYLNQANSASVNQQNTAVQNNSTTNNLAYAPTTNNTANNAASAALEQNNQWNAYQTNNTANTTNNAYDNRVLNNTTNNEANSAAAYQANQWNAYQTNNTTNNAYDQRAYDQRVTNNAYDQRAYDQRVTNNAYDQRVTNNDYDQRSFDQRQWADNRNLAIANTDARTANFDQRTANFDNRNLAISNADNRIYNADNRNLAISNADNRALALTDGRTANFDNRTANFDNRTANFDNRTANFDNRTANFDNRTANFDNRALAMADNRNLQIGIDGRVLTQQEFNQYNQTNNQQNWDVALNTSNYNLAVNQAPRPIIPPPVQPPVYPPVVPPKREEKKGFDFMSLLPLLALAIPFLFKKKDAPPPASPPVHEPPRRREVEVPEPQDTPKKPEVRTTSIASTAGGDIKVAEGTTPEDALNPARKYTGKNWKTYGKAFDEPGTYLVADDGSGSNKLKFKMTTTYARNDYKAGEKKGTIISSTSMDIDGKTLKFDAGKKPMFDGKELAQGTRSLGGVSLTYDGKKVTVKTEDDTYVIETDTTKLASNGKTIKSIAIGVIDQFEVGEDGKATEKALADEKGSFLDFSKKGGDLVEQIRKNKVG